MPTNKPAPLRAPEGRVLRRREVEAKVGHGHSWLYDKVRSGEFPEPVEIGKKIFRRLARIRDRRVDREPATPQLKGMTAF
jgi:hypothetical protein